MPGIEVPFRAPTPILFFVITILAAYFSFEPPSADLVTADAEARSQALRSFSWASASFFVTTGPLAWLLKVVEGLSIRRDRITDDEYTADWGIVVGLLILCAQGCGYIAGIVQGVAALRFL